MIADHIMSAATVATPLIALSAVGLAYRHYTKTLRPLVSLELSQDGLRLRNSGLGPAIIEDWCYWRLARPEVTYGTRELGARNEDLFTLLATMLGETPEADFEVARPAVGMALKAGDSLWLLKLPARRGHSRDAQREKAFEDLRTQLHCRIRYRGLYGRAEELLRVPPSETGQLRMPPVGGFLEITTRGKSRRGRDHPGEM